MKKKIEKLEIHNLWISKNAALEIIEVDENITIVISAHGFSKTKKYSLQRALEVINNFITLYNVKFIKNQYE